MKSRILAVLFAVVLTAGTLAGCGSSKKADDTKTETTDEKSEDKASSDEDTKDVNVASEEEAEEAGFSGTRCRYSTGHRYQFRETGTGRFL